jgi:hypothetical protein
MTMPLHSRSFYLLGDLGRGKTYHKETIGCLVLPEPRLFEEVVAAWSYAVRYSADGLDMPNYKKALLLLKQRHPSWIVVDAVPLPINYDPEYAEMDIPETR